MMECIEKWFFLLSSLQQAKFNLLSHYESKKGSGRMILPKNKLTAKNLYEGCVLEKNSAVFMF